MTAVRSRPMGNNSKRRAAHTEANRMDARRSIELQFGMRPGTLQPSRPNFLGRFTFIGQRAYTAFQNAIDRFRSARAVTKTKRIEAKAIERVTGIGAKTKSKSRGSK